MPTLNIQGKQVQVDDSFLQLSPEAQNSTVDEIAHSMGIGPDSGADDAPDIGSGRASTTAALRALPFIGAGVDPAVAALNAAAQPWIETGLSHAPTFSQRYAENRPLITGGTDKFEKDNPGGTTLGKMAIGSVPYVVAGEFAGPAKLLGMTGDTLRGMVGRGALSGAGIGLADAAARGENPIAGAASGFATGAVGPLAGRAVGATVRGVRNLVSTPKRVPITVDLNGNSVEVPKSAVSGDFNDQWQEERARKGVYGDDAQEVAQAADARRQAQTQAATQQFGDELRGGPGPAAQQPTPTEAAGQTITELAQQHNDAITAQARHEAQLAAEGAGIRTDVSAPLGAPEQPETPGVAYAQQIQHDLQAAEQRAAANRDTLYQRAAQFAGNFHPAAFTNIGNAIRNQLVQLTPGARPVTINPQLTPNAAAMLEMLETRLGFQDPVQRGGQMPLPYPRPLTAADIEAARQEMVGHLQDARAVQARGGSGTDAYAAQRVMDAFDRHLNTVLGTPGAFTGDAHGYQQAIRAARQGHASYRNTFTNQRRGDNVGPTIQKITGAYNAEPAGADTVARSIWGSPSNPGAGNTLAIGQRLQRIFGEGSPQMQAYKQGLINHILNTPEGMEALTPAKQADRLQTYLQTDHAREFFSDAERTRLMQHAQDLRAGGSIAPEARTEGQKLINKLADGTLSEQDLISRILLRDGTMSNGTLSLLKELQGKVSQPAWNKIRQVVWQGLNERPRGVTEWGPQALSQRISRFIGERGGQPSEGAQLLFSPRELEIMRSFADHHMALAPKPGVVNNSGSADIGMKLAKHGISHLGAMLGTMLGGHTFAGRALGMAAGEGLQRATGKLTNAQQVERTRQLFLGNRVMPELNPQYDRAAAILGHAARPVIGGP